MMRWPSIGSSASLWGLGLNRLAFLLLLLLLQQQGYSVAFVEDVDTRIASVSADGSHRGTQNTVYVHDGGRRQINGDRWGLQSEQVLPFRSSNEPEYHWNSLKPFGGRRRPFGSTAALAGAAVAAALLGVVYLLLSCGVFISRDTKTIQAWGSRRRLSSREDEGPCEQTAEADEEDAAGAAAETREDQEVSTSAVVSSLNPAAPAFTPRGVFNGGQDAGEGDLAAEEDPEGSTVSLEASASASSPETAAEGAAAAGEAAEEDDDAGPAEVVLGEGERPPLLWGGLIDKAAGYSPFVGHYLTRFRELVDHCRLYFVYLPETYARQAVQQLLLFAVIEFTTVTPLCNTEEERQLNGAIRALFRLCAVFNIKSWMPADVATQADRLVRALNRVRQRHIAVDPPLSPTERAYATREYLPPASAALRHMAISVNKLIQGLYGSHEGFDPLAFAIPMAVMEAVTDERRLQVLTSDAVLFMLSQLQVDCWPGFIFDQTHVIRSRMKYERGCGNPCAYYINTAAKVAAGRVAAEARQEKEEEPETAIAGAAGWDRAGVDDGNLVAGVAATAEGPLATTALEQQQREQQLQQMQQQPLLQQTASAVSASEGVYWLPSAAAPESVQEEVPATRDVAATEEPEAAAAAAGEREEVDGESYMRHATFASPSLPRQFFPRFPFGAFPHLPHFGRPPPTAANFASFQWPIPQVDQRGVLVRPGWLLIPRHHLPAGLLVLLPLHHGPYQPSRLFQQPQQQEEPSGASPQQQQGEPWEPSPQQQQQQLVEPRGFSAPLLEPGEQWDPFHGLQQQEGPSGASPQQQQGEPWGPSPQQQQQQQVEPWGFSAPLLEPGEQWDPFHGLQQQEGPSGASPQQQQDEPWGPSQQQQQQQHGAGWDPSAQQGQHAGPWGSWPQQYEPGDPWDTFPYQHDQKGAGGPSPQQQYLDPSDVFPPQQQRVGRLSLPSMQEQEQDETLGPLAQKQREPWDSSHPQDLLRHEDLLPTQQLQQEANWETSPTQQGPKQPWQPSPRQQQQPEEQWEPLPRQGGNEPWMSVLELLNGADDSSSHAYVESLGAAADVSPLPPSKSSPPKLPLGDQDAFSGSGDEGYANNIGVFESSDVTMPRAAATLRETTDLGARLQQQELKWPQPLAAGGVFRGTDYTAPSAAREETEYGGSVGATADRTSLVTPEGRRADLYLFERREGIDSDGEGDARKTGWFRGTDFTEPTVGQAPVGAAGSAGRPPLPQQQQSAPGRPDLFRGAGYTASSALQGETTGHGAQLPLQQQHPQQPLGASASIWSLTDIGNFGRADRRTGALTEVAPATEHDGSGGNIRQTPARAPAIGGLYAEVVKNGVKSAPRMPPRT